jgi:hypothetical protein
MREKQDEKDLFAFNYKFQGVAEKNPETQETVLVIRIKLVVRSIKELYWIYVRRVGFFQGVMSKGCKTLERAYGLLKRTGAYSQSDLIFNLQTGTRTRASHVQELALAHQIHGVPSS